MIGIDLGTTNSCVAIRGPFGGAEPVRGVAVGPDPPYDTVLRSAVFDPCGARRSIGGEAIRRFDRAPGTAPFLITFKPELEEQRLRTTVVRMGVGNLVYDPSEQAMVASTRLRVEEVGRSWSRRELVTSIELLAQHLIREAVAAGGEPDRILVGTPISFSSTARKRLLCGLRHARDRDGSLFFESWADLIDRVTFVLEPVAVAAGPIREAFDVVDRETVVIFDHGGGTLDLTLVEYERLPGFDRPMPVRQLGAIGSDQVAGRAIDAAFLHALLLGGHPVRTQLERQHPQVAAGLVEECKIDLSTRTTAEVFGVPVTRDEFERGVAPVVDGIEQLLRQLLDRAGCGVGDVDRVVMSGGSSCVPCVQERIRGLFGHLDATRVSAPIAPDGVEAAITDVARGLVSFAEDVEEALEQVVLWDVDLLASGADGFRRIVERGTPFVRADDGHLEVRCTIPLSPSRQATSFGIFEDQLGHRFVCGLANVPRHAGEASLELTLRPETAVPGLRVTDTRGQTLADGEIRTAFSEQDLNDWFEQDVGALPLVASIDLRSVPLDRLLRVGDVVEGVDRDGKRFHGEVKSMRHIPSAEVFEAMPNFESLPDIRFDIAPQPAEVRRKQVEYGGIRLAQKWAR